MLKSPPQMLKSPPAGRFVQKQYFDWIEREGIMPKDASAHFLDFITTHRKRHGENL